MRRLLLSLPLMLIAASCGGEPQQRQASEDLRTFDVQDRTPPPAPAAAPAMERTADANAGPNISPTAAPGVAFNYRYAFRLPAQRVSTVQEQHARACEQLGLSRCRITGMRYRVVNERDIQAMLAFKLEPTIARRFGQAGAQVVTQSEGMLVDAEITGTDVGTSIRAAGRNLAEMTEELNRLEARLARGGVARDERTRLEYEAQQLRQSIRATRANQQDQQESLATTPMVFEYGSGDLVPGFDSGPSFRKTLDRAGDNFVEGVAVLFIIVVTLLPWALLALLMWWIFRLLRRRFGRPAGSRDETVAPGPAAEAGPAPDVS
ncbi:MAG TPA: DUF4349 domain-containing protein [Allosphingosinicella sp.]|nr:DUF4349 domain-containing protein [Allosphingosinicella sp.]